MTEQLIILIEIILIDLVLAGDNAIIIGMVASKFEDSNRKKIIFWGIGGATMALLTPDVDFAYPNPVFFPFFYIHSLILLGVFFSVIALKQRPYLNDVHKVIGISLVLMIFIYLANFLLGDGANFWYLNDKPDNATIMNLFPDPPYHILVTIPVAIALFYIIYLPLWIKDAITKND